MANIMLWVWIAATVIFLVAEIFTAGFFIFCFGIGAAGAALVALVAPDAITWQMAAFVLLSAAAVILSRPFAERVTGRQAEEFGVGRLPGKMAVVLETIDPATNRGRVRADQEEWRADSVAGEVIEKGSRVEVIQVEGTRLVVRSLREPPMVGP